jgi:hypothetical protein
MARSADQVIADQTPSGKDRRERDQLRARVRDLENKLAEAEQTSAGLQFLSKAQIIAPPWLKVQRPTGLHHATPALIFSDMHLDEVVRPEEVEGLNAYNREIAVLRMRACFEHAVMVARQYIAGVQHDGFLLELLGDTFSGTIHDELTQTNEDTSFGSLLFWAEQLAGMVGGLADEFGKVHVVAVVGNHGRQTRKPRAKFRARDNLDWLLAHMLALALKKDDRITWSIPETADAEVRVYSTTIRETHGDQARGGVGISGKKTPLALLEFRKARRALQVETLKARVKGGVRLGASHSTGLFDVMHHGHFHEYEPGRILGNGSLKGVDEFSYTGNFGVEEPIQAFFLVTPEHGVSLHAPIYCSAGRKKEQW